MNPNSAGRVRSLVTGVNDCDCPLIVGTHRYGDGCMTACPDCGSIPRCAHDDDDHLDDLRYQALRDAAYRKASDV